MAVQASGAGGLLPDREARSGRDLTAFFDQVYRSSNVFDYGVQDLESVREGDRFRTTVVVRRYGEAMFPIDVLVTFKNGERVTEHWDGRERWKVYVVRSAVAGARRRGGSGPRAAARRQPHQQLADARAAGVAGGEEMVGEVDGVAAGLPAVVGGAWYDDLAFVDGIRRVNRAPAILVGVWALTLLVSLPLAVAMRGMIAQHLGAASPPTRPRAA